MSRFSWFMSERPKFPSPSRFARHLSPFQGARKSGGKLGAFPRPHKVGERWRAKRDGEGGRPRKIQLAGSFHCAFVLGSSTW
jgi:hypothetical protein